MLMINNDTPTRVPDSFKRVAGSLDTRLVAKQYRIEKGLLLRVSITVINSRMMLYSPTFPVMKRKSP